MKRILISLITFTMAILFAVAMFILIHDIIKVNE